MDKVTNSSGNKLLDICRNSNLKIVNGRLGDDAGIGSYSNISARGNSIIDYAICSHDLFSLIYDFIVHDHFSSHLPIQLDFNVLRNEQWFIQYQILL